MFIIDHYALNIKIYTLPIFSHILRFMKLKLQYIILRYFGGNYGLPTST